MKLWAAPIMAPFLKNSPKTMPRVPRAMRGATRLVAGRREDSRRYSAQAAVMAALKLQLWLTADMGAEEIGNKNGWGKVGGISSRLDSRWVRTDGGKAPDYAPRKESTERSEGL